MTYCLLNLATRISNHVAGLGKWRKLVVLREKYLCIVVRLAINYQSKISEFFEGGFCRHTFAWKFGYTQIPIALSQLHFTWRISIPNEYRGFLESVVLFKNSTNKVFHALSLIVLYWKLICKRKIVHGTLWAPRRDGSVLWLAVAAAEPIAPISKERPLARSLVRENVHSYYILLIDET